MSAIRVGLCLVSYRCRTFSSSREMGCPVLRRFHTPYRWAKRIVIAVVGGTVVLIGIAMIVLPGPAIVVIPMGLGILGLEFAWAKRWLEAIKARGTLFANAVFRKRPPL